MHLKNGWTWDNFNGALCRFRHHPRKDAMAMVHMRDMPYVVEAINPVFGDGDENTCHLNQYFAMDLAAAIGLAAQMEIASNTVEETVVGIRRATEEEYELSLRVGNYFHSRFPPAISEKKASSL